MAIPGNNQKAKEASMRNYARELEGMLMGCKVTVEVFYNRLFFNLNTPLLDEGQLKAIMPFIQRYSGIIKLHPEHGHNYLVIDTELRYN